MDQIGSLLSRPRLYYNIDGLAELGGGLFSLGIAILLWLPADSVWHRFSWLFFIALVGSIHFGTKAIKNHITYPRTGFVEYRRDERRRASIVSAIASVLVVVGLTAAVRTHWEVAPPFALAGLIFAAVYAHRIAGAVHWKRAVACAIALASIAIAFLPADVLAAMANDSIETHPVLTRLVGTMVASFMTYGAMLAISGGISFWLYLRHTQPATRELP